MASSFFCLYHEQSKEDLPHNINDLKRHWIKTLCNGMKKLMGKPGGGNDRIHWCISNEKRILNQTHSGMLGLSSDDEDDVARGEDNDLFGEEPVGEGGSMSHLNQHKMRMMTGIQTLLSSLVICLLSLVLLSPLLLLPPHPRKVQDTGDNKGVTAAPSMPASSNKGVTMAPSMSASSNKRA